MTTTRLTSIEILHSHGPQVILVARADGRYRPTDERTCQEFNRAQGGPAGIVLVGPDWRHHWGEDQISYTLGDGLHLKIDADAFSQVNTQGNQVLLEEFLRWTNLHGQDRVLELYSGAGNLTLPMARKAGHVVAVEAHRGLARNGRRNTRRNGLNNIEWHCETARAAVSRMPESQKSFQIIVMNPPRSGAKDVVRQVTRLGARRIYYVACDPATMARDVGQLGELGYHLERVRPIDLFPQTHHVEVLVELQRDTEPREPS